MKKILQKLFTTLLLFSLVTTSFGQIYMDGDNSDWNQYPLLIEAPNNDDSLAFPHVAMAAVTDIVDIKYVKAAIIDNILYGYIEFWGGPAWPNNAYENEQAVSIMNRGDIIVFYLILIMMQQLVGQVIGTKLTKLLLDI